jgi:hypothetical protein
MMLRCFRSGLGAACLVAALAVAGCSEAARSDGSPDGPATPVQVEVENLAVDPHGVPVVVLREKGGKLRRLPIWIGETQARSIHNALNGVEEQRPNTHDLMVSMLGRLRARVERVTVTEVRGETYYAVIEITGSKGLDARPSDAIALAMRTSTPIFVAESVLEAGSGLDGKEAPDEEPAIDIDWPAPAAGESRAAGHGV